MIVCLKLDVPRSIVSVCAVFNVPLLAVSVDLSYTVMVFVAVPVRPRLSVTVAVIVRFPEEARTLVVTDAVVYVAPFAFTLYDVIAEP